ncbi:M15 family metallopeptidase [Uliginosibacterium gangwonense]|uniref:M15 family metallopeptidase n=1 Tax=Uliginosibacterium gangwonense TaxID=392736 RepID=UPI000526D50E|nr:M15 family metallopeptidase [Uliginosibacterium gangwonense]
MLDAQALTGRSRSHVQEFVLPDGSHFLAHAQAGEALLALKAAAHAEGIELAIASAYRSFEDQARIWQRKWHGERILLDAQCRPIDHACLAPDALVETILEWSALPGASRHHWGCEFDIYDRAAMPSDYELQLIPSEYASDGIFAALTAWLDANMARFGFFRPYDIERGGVHPEPWHLSWAPLSVPALAALSPDVLRECITGADLAGKEAILAKLESIYARHVCRVASPAFALPAPPTI